MNDAVWILIWKHIDRHFDERGQLALREEETMTQIDVIILTPFEVIVSPADKIDFQRRYSMSGRPIFEMHVPQPDRVADNSNE